MNNRGERVQPCLIPLLCSCICEKWLLQIKGWLPIHKLFQPCVVAPPAAPVHYAGLRGESCRMFYSGIQEHAVKDLVFLASTKS